MAEMFFLKIENEYSKGFQLLERLTQKGCVLTNEDIKLISNVTAIEFLEGCKVAPNHTEYLSKFIKLQRVYFYGNNGISDISFVSTLSDLKYLFLRDNPVCDISPLEKCIELRSLYLCRLPIDNIAPISGLKSLNHLVLNCLDLTSFPRGLVELDLPFWVDSDDPPYSGHDESRGIWMENTKLTNPPLLFFKAFKALFHQQQPDRQLILDWYDKHEIKPLREGKVIFLGDGGVGKTYTIERIKKNGKKPTQDTSMTPGIQMEEVTIPAQRDTPEYHEKRAKDYAPEVHDHELT